MRRIYIERSIDDVADEFAENLLSNARNDCKPKELLKRLRDEIERDKRNKNWMKYYNYVNAVYDEYEKILVLHPDGNEGFEEYRKKHLNMLSFDELKSRKWKKGRKNLMFYEAIVAAMRYEDVRSQEIIKYINKKEIGIKVCVYCNANYIVTVDIAGEGIKARYEVDHFLPKSKYPFLSTSFFNFQPSCPFCNRWKWKNESIFNLYTEDKTVNINPFIFSLSSKSISLYKTSYNCDDLEIIVDSTEVKKINGNNIKLIDNHDEVFHINDLYKSFKDEAEEILIKSFFNTKSYLDQMYANILSSVSVLSDKEAFRLVYGFYLEEENIHKRPLTKMKQDIAKQLGLI